MPPMPPCLHIRLQSECRSLAALPHGETSPTMHQVVKTPWRSGGSSDSAACTCHQPTCLAGTWKYGVVSTINSIPRGVTGENGGSKGTKGTEFSLFSIFFSIHNPVFRLLKPSTTRRESDGVAETGASRIPLPIPTAKILVSVTSFHFLALAPRSLTLFSPRSGRRLV